MSVPRISVPARVRTSLSPPPAVSPRTRSKRCVAMPSPMPTKTRLAAKKSNCVMKPTTRCTAPRNSRRTTATSSVKPSRASSPLWLPLKTLSRAAIRPRSARPSTSSTKHSRPPAQACTKKSPAPPDPNRPAVLAAQVLPRAANPKQAIKVPLSTLRWSMRRRRPNSLKTNFAQPSQRRASSAQHNTTLVTIIWH